MRVTCQFYGKNLDKKDTFGDSDPYLVVCQLIDDENNPEELTRTQVIKNNLNPSWEPITFDVEKKPKSSRDIHFKIKVFDEDLGLKDDLIGEFYTCLSEMVKANHTGVQWKLINPDFVRKRDYKHSGLIFLSTIQVAE